MSNFISPVQNNNSEEQSKTTEPDKLPPPPDRFRKLVKRDGAPPQKEEMEQMSAEIQESDISPPSLFDLAQTKTKGRSPLQGQEEKQSPFSELAEKGSVLAQSGAQKNLPTEKSTKNPNMGLAATPEEKPLSGEALPELLSAHEEPSTPADAVLSTKNPAEAKQAKNPSPQPVETPSSQSQESSDLQQDKIQLMESTLQQPADKSQKKEPNVLVAPDKNLPAQPSEQKISKEPAAPEASQESLFQQQLTEGPTKKAGQPPSSQESQAQTTKLANQQAPLQNPVPIPKELNKEPVQKKGDFSSKDQKEAIDSPHEGKADPTAMAALNPTIQGVGLGAEKAQTPEKSASATLADLANQLIETIQTMRKEDKTETIVTLKHPPMLAGATVTLIASDNAKREFNVAFAGLTPAAKMFLDQKLAEHSLTETLERKGIVIHMVNTSTEPHNLLNVDAGQAATRDREQQQREQQQQQEQQKKRGGSEYKQGEEEQR